MAAPHVTLLLAGGERFGAQRLSGRAAALIGRADRLPAGAAGSRGQLLRHFQVLPRRLSIAALSRQDDAGDAAGACWLRADPAWVRPDINGARLLAIGSSLGLGEEDCVQLLPALRPLFGDAGFPLDAPTPERWYLRLPPGTRLPEFTDPADALGADLFDLLAEGGEGRRWRALLNEAQIVLHNHPWNARRAERGLMPINSLWFWGAGVLPDSVDTGLARIVGQDESLRALTRAAGAAWEALPGRFAQPDGDSLYEMRDARDLSHISAEWIVPAADALMRGRLASLTIDLEDGRGWRLLRRHRLRLWRGPLRSLAP